MLQSARSGYRSRRLPSGNAGGTLGPTGRETEKFRHPKTCPVSSWAVAAAHGTSGEEVPLSTSSSAFIVRYRRSLSGGILVVSVVAFLVSAVWFTGPILTPAGRALLANPAPQGDDRSIERNIMGHGMPPPPSGGKTASGGGNKELSKAKREEAQRDVATLAELAESLKKDLAQANENVVPVSTMEKAEKIEKLAKKLKNWAKYN